MSIILFIVLLLGIAGLAFAGMFAFLASFKDGGVWAFIFGLMATAVCAFGIWKLLPYVETFQ
jgi:hypothetical protein